MTQVLKARLTTKMFKELIFFKKCVYFVCVRGICRHRSAVEHV